MLALARSAKIAWSVHDSTYQSSIGSLANLLILRLLDLRTAPDGSMPCCFLRCFFRLRWPLSSLLLGELLSLPSPLLLLSSLQLLSSPFLFLFFLFFSFFVFLFFSFALSFLLFFFLLPVAASVVVAAANFALARSSAASCALFFFSLLFFFFSGLEWLLPLESLLLGRGLLECLNPL